MRTCSQLFLKLLLAPVVLGLAAAQAEELKSISLLAPQIQSGKPLMQALKERKTNREFKPGKLTDQTLSEVLWAGFGVNRPENDHRTAPSAMNSQEIDIYVALPEGLYLYEAKPHSLKPVLTGDLRAKTSGQPYMKDVAAVLIYVADLPRLTKAKPDTRPFYAGFDAGCICQNVYLYCASAGLATVVYDLNRTALAEAMKLKPDQQIIMAQAVGYPKE